MGPGREVYDSNDDVERIPQHQPKFLGLTQVCRNIRAEYPPPYRAKTTVNIRADVTYNYIKSHLTPLENKDEEISSNILVDFSASDDQVLDAGLLLQLWNKSHRLPVEIVGIKTSKDGDDNYGIVWDLVDQILIIRSPSLLGSCCPWPSAQEADSFIESCLMSDCPIGNFG